MPRGGKRPGAGPKFKEVTQLKNRLQKNFASLILSDTREANLWKEKLDSENEKVALDALKALSEFKHGKAKQSIDLDGHLNLVARVDVNL